ncbi:methionyl-tRNA formyltransferase [Clostridium sp.]|uniref:methionyl-tRNA formyltransferase n=1 Tax=Clostridium sp. TaxID=1506 RepID=UPI003216E559
MNVLFMGGHELGAITLENLILNNINIVGVVVTETDNEWYSGVDLIANKHNIKLYRESNINNINFINSVKKLNVDLITSVNFGQILKSDIINLPSKGCINTHASLLPNYRGRAPLNWAILSGEKEVGVTVHYIEEGIDTGDIIIQERIAVKDTDYIGDVLNSVKSIYPGIVLEAVKLIENNKVVAVTQDISKGSYYGKRSTKDGEIDVNKSSNEIMNLIRAVSKPYPGSFVKVDGKRIIIWKAEIIDNNINKYNIRYNGQFVERNNEIVIKVRDGLLVAKEYEWCENQK